MKMKWLSLVGLFVLLMSVATYLFVTQLKIVGGWNEEVEESIVMPNKTWKLTFSEKIDEKTVNENTVFVLDDKGERMDAIVTLTDNQKTIVIEPPMVGYDLDVRFYTLHLAKGIKSIYGKALGSTKEIKFVVKESLPVVGSKDKLNQYFKDVLEDEEERNHFSTATMEMSKESEDSSAGMENTTSQDVSETNIQVQGVDESDIVKTNGSHIYQVVDGKINIIETNNNKDLKLLEPISYKNTFYPFQLFLHNNKLLVLGHSYEERQVEEREKDTKDLLIAPVNDSTKAIVYDISDPGQPKEERSVTLDGHLISSRKVDGNVYLVTNQYPQYWIMRENEEVDLRPRYSDTSTSEGKIAVDYDEIQYFPDSKEANYTMIAAFDLNDPEEEAKISTYLGSGNLMYMSKENLYLAVQDWGVRPLIDSRGIESSNTTVYKFAIDGLDVAFDSSTELEGRILNQFSMDEHNGYFRVATTKGMVWDEERPSANNLFIFDEHLKMVSSIEDLARGERIYSARFMGDRIYIVTFKETDPLFVIDASNPKSPEVLGELKIPGFSNYLHPYDENHLIGFGHDTKVVPSKESSEPMILTEGVKLSLFDVTDMKNPKEKFTEVIGGRGTYSPLNYDHKALLFNKEKDIFAFPINIYESVEGKEFEQTFEFQGAYVFNIDSNEGFNLASKISHMKGKTPYEEWEHEIQRMLYIGDTLYALSNSKVSTHTMDDYRLIEELSLKN